MTDAECMEYAHAVGEAARAELPDGARIFITVFDDHDSAAAYGTGELERTQKVLADMLTVTRLP